MTAVDQLAPPPSLPPRPERSGRAARVVAVGAALLVLVGVLVLPQGDPADANGYAGTSIMGSSLVAPGEIATWFRQSSTQPYRATVPIDELARIYVEEGAAEGVRGDIAFTQAIWETGWFAHVPANNFAGMGWCNTCTSGMQFPTARDGVRAHIQHLRNYADPTVTAAALANPAWSDRYDSFGLHGRAPLWEDLNGRWAVPGDTYAQNILGVYSRLAAHAGVDPSCPGISAVEGAVTVPGWGVAEDGAVAASGGAAAIAPPVPLDLSGVAPGPADVDPAAILGAAVAEGAIVLPPIDGAPPVVAAVVSTGTGQGAWIVYDDGSVVVLGDAPDLGSVVVPPSSPVVAAARSGKTGLWLVTARGAVATLGGAPTFAPLEVATLGPVVGITATPTGAGYWLVSEMGAVYAFGDAPFAGVHPQVYDATTLAPVVGLVGTATGGGYWLADGDGHLVAFGDAPSWGELAGCGHRAVVGVHGDPGGDRVWLETADGLWGFGAKGTTGWLVAAARGVAFTPTWG